MVTTSAIRRMRAVRAFAPRPLDSGHLRRIVDAGRRAPSSMNSQPWAFVVVQDRDRLRELSTVGAYAGHVARAGAAVAVVTPDPEDAERLAWIQLDVGQATQNMMLAAWDHGVGSVHAAVDDRVRAQEVLGHPDGHRCDLLLSLGYREDPSLLQAPPRKGGRRALAEVVHWERW